MSVRILDEHDEISTGVGEIRVKNKYLITGYASNARRYTKMKDGYVSIGETWRRDDSVHLFISGRKSRQAQVADNFLYLQEVERGQAGYPTGSMTGR